MAQTDERRNTLATKQKKSSPAIAIPQKPKPGGESIPRTLQGCRMSYLESWESEDLRSQRTRAEVQGKDDERWTVEEHWPRAVGGEGQLYTASKLGH